MSKSETTPGVIWHIDVIPALEKFDPVTRDRLFMASLYNRRDGIEPDFSDNPLADMFWTMYQPRIDSDESGYYDAQSNGKLGGMYRGYKQSCRVEGEEPLSYALWKETVIDHTSDTIKTLEGLNPHEDP